MSNGPTVLEVLRWVGPALRWARAARSLRLTVRPRWS